FFASALDFRWVISKIYLRTYLALPTVFPQLFGQGHGILRIASDYAIETTFPPVARSFLSDSSIGMTPIRRSLSTISWGSIPTLMLLERARFLTSPQFEPSGVSSGQSLP